MTLTAGYTGIMKRVYRTIVILTIVVIATSCLIIPPSPTADEHAPDSAAADGTPVAGDSESAGDSVPSTPGVVAEQEGAPPLPVAAPEDALPRPDEIPVRVLAAGSQSAVRVPVAGAITSQVVLEEVWFAIHANQLRPPEVPQVDFGSETVIILILGERRSAGYSVQTAGIALRDDSVEVRIEVSSPGPDVMTASVLTSAFELSAIWVIDMPVTFVGDDLQNGYDDE
ncbi:MAG: protease complex subunit PrcB family protein [Spirochaetia bacterium]